VDDSWDNASVASDDDLEDDDEFPIDSDADLEDDDDEFPIDSDAESVEEDDDMVASDNDDVFPKVENDFLGSDSEGEEDRVEGSEDEDEEGEDSDEDDIAEVS
jgi:hypothetical protein